MKKLFLFTLLACFFCVGAYAVTVVNVSTEGELRAALTTADETADSTQITLTKSITGSSVFEVGANSHVQLNLAGFALTQTFVDSDQSPHVSSILWNKGILHIISEGQGMVISPSNAMEQGFCICNSGDLTIDGGIFVGQSADFNVGYFFLNPVIAVEGGSPTTTINGGTFIMAKKPDGMCFSWQGIIAGTPTIRGGVFSSADIGSNGANNLGTYVAASGSSVETVAFNETYAPWVSSVYWVKPAGTESITENTTIDEENNEQEAVFVAANTTLTVPEGQTLTITNDLAFKDATSQLVIEPNATVIIGDEVVSGSTNNIALTVDDKNHGYSNLLVAAGELQESHPKATVAFNTKARRNADTHKLIWQRFAVPSHTTFNIDDLVNVYGFETCVEGWDYANNCWKIINSGESLEPFQMYALAINNEIDPATQNAQYNFPCELVGNGNPELTIRTGWNYFANAYTAPMNLKAWLNDLLNDPTFDGVIDGTIYVQKLQESNAWNSITAERAKKGKFGTLSAELQPMQAFIYHATANTTIPLKYKEYVYDPLVNPASAPARKEAKEAEYKEATIIVTPAEGDEDYLFLYEGADFSEAFDNGFDAIKYLNDDVLNAYFVTSIGDLSDYATDNLENASFSVKTAEAGDITISFEDVTLEGYSILDVATNTKTEIKNGKSYVFSGSANATYTGRFVIVKNGDDPSTSVDKIEEANKAKGIYTVTGQYMGNNLNALPAGVYVINGKKVVR